MVAVSTLRHQCRTKALLIALSYNSRKGVPSLATTHADLDRLAQHLVEYWGYCPQCITKMRDGEGDAALRPTKENILREIENLVRDVETGDRRVFYFAGHCYQIVNHRGTEIDDLDEVILVDGDCDPTPLIPEEDGTCLDFSKIQPKERQMILHGVIIDNELRRHLVDRIPLGAKLVAISDTCHSGTLFDLDYHWQDEDSSLSQVRTLIRPGILPRAWMRRKRSSKVVHAQVGKKPMDVRRREEVVFSMKSSGMQSPKRGRSQTIKPMFASKDFIGFYNNDDEPWFKDREPCLSPSWEDMPEVISIASSYDSQSTMSGKKSMTVVLIEILERRKQKPIRTRKLNHQLNCEMRDLRCELMHKHWTENKRSMSFIQKALRTLRRVQQPVIGSLSPDTPEKIFEF